MPGRLKVRILSGRDLPIMDRASELTDAFVEVRFGSDTYKTDVCKKSLNPQWNSEWFKFEAEDEVLQDEPLDIKVLDYDTYSAHDAIGKVYIDLNPLLTREAPNIISGWFPIYDTMHGIRGELNIQVRVELFSDFNKFRQSSCGIQFFCSAGVPCGWRIQETLGFVEELVVNDDPEYQWIDKIRTPRASNEARQRLFSKLSGELQRKLGVKVLEMGGNVVLGYHQNFDIEGESGIVVRAIGTAVSLMRITVSQSSPILPIHGSPGVLSSNKDTPQEEYFGTSTPGESSNLPGLDSPNVPPFSPGTAATTPSASSSQSHQQPQNRHSASPVRVVSTTGQNRRLSDSEVSSAHQAGANVSTPSINPSTHSAIPKGVGLLQSIDMVEYPFFTMSSFPPGFIVNLGGVVSARSVKLLDKIHNPEEPETRDAWWSEVRTEIRAHATKLGCHAVLAYQEHTAICDEVIIMSAMGTAAKINLTFNNHGHSQQYQSLSSGLGLTPHTPTPASGVVDKTPPVSGGKGLSNSTSGGAIGDKVKERGNHHLFVDISLANQALECKEEFPSRCSLCHIPYSPNNLPFEIQLSKCALCRKHFVPEVLFTTIDPPDNMPICSRGSLIQARLCRAKSKNKNSEQSAREVSDSLPFIEYEIHNQLINKMKIRGLNCLFGLKIQISLGENILAAVATATGTYLGPLPAPPVPVLSTQVATAEESRDIMNLQRKFAAMAQMHRDCLSNEIGDILTDLSPPSPDTDDESDNGDEDNSNTELLVEKTKDRNTFVLVVDDLKDESMSLILEDTTPPEGFDICNTQSPLGISADRLTGNLQLFAQVVHVRFNPTMNTALEFSNIFNTVLRRICFKMRSFKPCCLTDVNFIVDLADEDEVTVVATGCCLPLEEPSNGPPFKFLNQTSESSRKASANQTDEMMFPLDGVGDQTQPNQTAAETVQSQNTESSNDTSQSIRVMKSKGIAVTPLSCLPDCHITNYLGYYNFFFIRESTSVKENGGIGGFMQGFLVQVLAIVRAHVKALGGNALVAFNMWQCVLDNNPHKNQGQCLINVSGDIVLVTHVMDRNDAGDTSSLVIPSSTS